MVSTKISGCYVTFFPVPPDDLGRFFGVHELLQWAGGL